MNIDLNTLDEVNRGISKAKALADLLSAIKPDEVMKGTVQMTGHMISEYLLQVEEYLS